MPTSEFTPTVDQVGSMLPNRTVNDAGERVGTFDDSTRPTDAQVDSLIGEAVNEIASAIGEDLPDALGDDPDAIRKQAEAIVRLLSAMNVELTYFGEQVGTQRSPYTAFERRFNSGLKTLKERVAEARGGGDGESVAEGGGMPAYGFPADAGGMLGWGTRW